MSGGVKMSEGIQMNCNIRPWKIEDAGDLALALNNKKIHDNLRDGLPFPYTTQDAEGFIHDMLSANKDKIYAFAITIDDKVIGSIGIFRKENIHSRTAEMGYYISENYWGKGIGTIAAKKACNYVFHNTNILRIFAEPFSNNVASCRILEKAGFVCEGVLRRNAVKNGKVLDMKMYSLVNDSDL